MYHHFYCLIGGGGGHFILSELFLFHVKYCSSKRFT